MGVVAYFVSGALSPSGRTDDELLNNESAEVSVSPTDELPEREDDLVYRDSVAGVSEMELRQIDVVSDSEADDLLVVAEEGEREEPELIAPIFDEEVAPRRLESSSGTEQFRETGIAGAARSLPLLRREDTGWILVRTSPPGATVILDGATVGLTPLSLSGVAFGTHGLEVNREGFQSVKREVNLNAVKSILPVGIDMRVDASEVDSELVLELVGSMAVQSRPAGGRVLVNGLDVGLTPLVIKRPVGQYSVSIESEGYQSWLTTVEIVATQQVQIKASLERDR